MKSIVWLNFILGISFFVFSSTAVAEETYSAEEKFACPAIIEYAETFGPSMYVKSVGCLALHQSIAKAEAELDRRRTLPREADFMVIQATQGIALNEGSSEQDIEGWLSRLSRLVEPYEENGLDLGMLSHQMEMMPSRLNAIEAKLASFGACHDQFKAKGNKGHCKTSPNWEKWGFTKQEAYAAFERNLERQRTNLMAMIKKGEEILPAVERRLKEREAVVDEASEYWMAGHNVLSDRFPKKRDAIQNRALAGIDKAAEFPRYPAPETRCGGHATRGGCGGAAGTNADGG